MKSLEKSGELNTILGKGTKFEGKISVQHSLRVDGRFEGDIDTTDTLVIGKEGEVIGNTKVKDLVIGGKLNGTVVAQGKIVLESKSEFRGEMRTNKLVIDEGAIFEGKCSMSGEGKTTDFSKIKKPEKFGENNTH
ncbi:MAG: polymer-forming cytoskeletal protein [Calditrichaeota bacterium]|nr:polymer-forming cytoskeletal protein [Calditrichota bacterium]